MNGKPFQRGRFEALPEKPHRPHDYERTAARTTAVNSEHFGRVNVHYRELGEGPPLLLVHGLMTTSYSWRYVMAPLAKHYRVIAPDLVGCGRTDKPTEVPYTAHDVAAFVGELMHVLGIHGCDAVGNSMGGYLCMRLALQNHASFRRLVNLHSPAAAEPRLYALRTALGAPGVARALAAYVRRDPLRWVHKNVHYYDESLKSLEEAREYGDPLRDVAGSKAFVQYLGTTLDPVDLSTHLTRLRERRDAEEKFPMPLMLLYSRTDALVNPENGTLLQKLVPEAKLQWLDRTSHFAHVDTPDEVVEALLRFFHSSGERNDV